jgi:hypothetical protein
MTRACPTVEENVMLLDGELTENRADEVREHLATCAACRAEAESLRALVADLAAPVEPRPGALVRVLARLDEEPWTSGRRWAPSLAAGAVGLFAAAAAAALAPVVVRRVQTPSVMTARGGGPDQRSLAREVGVTVYRHGAGLDPIAPGEEVSADTPYAVAFRNLGPSDSAFMMVFAEDAAHDLHWIEPAWLDPTEDPASLSLPHADREGAPRTSVVLDRPAVGALRLFVVVSPHPLRVSDVERLGSTPLDASALRARWPEGVVDEMDVQVAPGDGGEAR